MCAAQKLVKWCFHLDLALPWNEIAVCSLRIKKHDAPQPKILLVDYRVREQVNAHLLLAVGSSIPMHCNG
jgi:hypothetical protein